LTATLLKRAELVFIGREMLKDPFWARTAADYLRTPIRPSVQYTRYGSAWQRTQPPLPPAPLDETVAAHEPAGGLDAPAPGSDH